jgi:hypothetical protein
MTYFFNNNCPYYLSYAMPPFFSTRAPSILGILHKPSRNAGQLRRDKSVASDSTPQEKQQMAEISFRRGQQKMAGLALPGESIEKKIKRPTSNKKKAYGTDHLNHLDNSAVLAIIEDITGFNLITSLYNSFVNTNENYIYYNLISELERLLNVNLFKSIVGGSPTGDLYETRPYRIFRDSSLWQKATDQLFKKKEWLRHSSFIAKKRKKNPFPMGILESFIQSYGNNSGRIARKIRRKEKERERSKLREVVDTRSDSKDGRAEGSYSTNDAALFYNHSHTHGKHVPEQFGDNHFFIEDFIELIINTNIEKIKPAYYYYLYRLLATTDGDKSDLFYRLDRRHAEMQSAKMNKINNLGDLKLTQSTAAVQSIRRVRSGIPFLTKFDIRWSIALLSHYRFYRFAPRPLGLFFLFGAQRPEKKNTDAFGRFRNACVPPKARVPKQCLFFFRAISEALARGAIPKELCPGIMDKALFFKFANNKYLFNYLELDKPLSKSYWLRRLAQHKSKSFDCAEGTAEFLLYNLWENYGLGLGLLPKAVDTQFVFSSQSETIRAKETIFSFIEKLIAAIEYLNRIEEWKEQVTPSVLSQIIACDTQNKKNLEMAKKTRNPEPYAKNYLFFSNRWGNSRMLRARFKIGIYGAFADCLRKHQE